MNKINKEDALQLFVAAMDHAGACWACGYDNDRLTCQEQDEIEKDYNDTFEQFLAVFTDITGWFPVVEPDKQERGGPIVWNLSDVKPPEEVGEPLSQPRPPVPPLE